MSSQIGMPGGDPRHVAETAGREPQQCAMLSFVGGGDVHEGRRRELGHVADERDEYVVVSRA